jgi:S-(hydroxymethyl)glutathione dehydrogenase/alcohol dehydrogenase
LRNLSSETLHAAVCHRFGEPLTVQDVELQPPAPGEVTVRVSACGICHSDVSFIDGAWGGPLPAVYGHEVAGVVTEVGIGVGTVKPGDHAVVTLIRSCGQCYFCARGEMTQCAGTFAIDDPGPLRLPGGWPIKQGLHVAGFAESVTVHVSQVVPIPADIPFESACLLACAVATGVGAVRNTAKVQAGSSVVVVGAGGVGLNSIQGAALLGAQPVIAVDVLDPRLTAARAFGASHVVNPRQVDGTAAVRGLTAGRGADYSIITSGDKTAIEFGLGLTRRGGTSVIVGIPATGVSVTVDPGEIADSGRLVLGSKMGSTHPHADLPALVDMYVAGRLKLDQLVTAKFPLEKINEAIADAKRGEGLRTVILM